MNKSDDLDVFKEIIERWESSHGEQRSSILIMHLCIEYRINKIIMKAFKNPNAFEKLSFTQKITILDGLGIFPQNTIKDLRVINEARNLFAHIIEIESDEFEKRFLKKMQDISFYNELGMGEPIYAFNVFSMVTIRMLNLLVKAYEIMEKMSKT